MQPEDASGATAPRILILTPMKNAGAYLDDYFANLRALATPHRTISLGFLESDSTDGTYARLEQERPALEEGFRRVTLIKRDFGFRIPAGMPRWHGLIQYERRSVLARSRNHLLFGALEDEDWVLWLDADVCAYAPDILERLLATGKDIVQPHCVLEPGGLSFDRNAWRDRKRLLMHHLRGEGDLVPLHGVGGAMLLVRADLHRDGLVFPPFQYGRASRLIPRFNLLFSNWREAVLNARTIPGLFRSGRWRGEIETEGLGIMAHDMGRECWGMPNLEIVHRQ